LEVQNQWKFSNLLSNHFTDRFFYARLQELTIETFQFLKKKYGQIWVFFQVSKGFEKDLIDIKSNI